MLALLFSLLFLVGAIYNLAEGIYYEFVGGLCFSGALAAFYFFEKYQHKQDILFFIWLRENKEKLKKDKMNSLLWKNKPINYYSNVTQYQFCTSFLVVSFKQSTGYILETSINKGSINILSSLLTLILGWWSFPSGPINTIQCLRNNYRGGIKSSIKEIIEIIEAQQSGNTTFTSQMIKTV